MKKMEEKKMPKESTKILLDEKDMPRQWYNVLPDLPVPLKPPVSPATGKPITPDELLAIFPGPLLEQEMSTQSMIDIPEEVLDIYRLWRPAPLYRARRLEQMLKTPAKIYYKYEGVSPAGSHKVNTAVPQAYFNKQVGIMKLATETGAGQWGSALSFAASHFGMEVQIYMVRVSYDQKPYRKFMMETWGGTVYPSPSNLTNAGREALAKDPNSSGSLGLAISEAVEVAATNKDINYALGSVLNHVLLHQTIIGLEAQKQLALVGDYPDVVIGCVGGGSNFGGLALPYVRDKINGKNIDFIAVEPAACPTLTKGEFIYDYGDVAKMAPIVEMYTLGHTFMPPGIHAGGLRYHGMSPIISLLKKHNVIRAMALKQKECFEAAITFAKTEGIIAAPESSHAIRAAIIEAEKAKQEGKEKVILFNLSGHGHFDLASYDMYLSGKLEDYEYPESLIKEALKDVPDVKL
jgi:tryptophan synthase beta chain